MRDRSHLRPARPDLKVHDPVARDFLPSAGREVRMSLYWQRRLADGDVVVVGAELERRKKPKAPAEE